MRNSIRALIALCVASSMPAAALAGPFEDGTTAYENGNYTEALRQFEIAAGQGNSNAQYVLGAMYGLGKGVTQDYAEALRWLKLSAAQGNGEAEFALGVTYETGSGVAVDDAEALRWYRLAAAQGVADADDAAKRLSQNSGQ